MTSENDTDELVIPAPVPAAPAPAAPELAPSAPPAPANERRVGVFGKLPSLGDFITRGLPASFTDPWHAWLVRGLADARQILGDRFEPAYMSAPVWRFALPCGVAGPDAATGIFLPSVDAVGRLFPLTLAVTAASPFPFSVLVAAEEWFEKLEEAARTGLSQDFALDTWLEGLGRLIPPSDGTAPPPAAWQRRDAVGHAPALCALHLLADFGVQVTTVFWSDGSPFVAPGCTRGRGLPNETDFASLFADASHLNEWSGGMPTEYRAERQ
jgi:type VI secretion system protein ImpM